MENMTYNINDFFNPIVEFLSKILFWDLLSLFDFKIDAQLPLIVVWLFIGAIFFTIKMRFVNIYAFRHAIQLVIGKFSKGHEEGEISHYKALSAAISGTVGLGNIAGVAIAISVGGAGATFWMIIAGFLGMSMKFVECSLAVKYRKIDDQGKTYGGPMYYIKQAFYRKNYKITGKVLGGVFAFLLIIASFGGGNMFQSNQAFSIVSDMFPAIKNYSLLFGLIFSAFAGVTIIGGIKSITKVTSKLVPLMAIIYVAFSLFIIFANIEKFPSALVQIFNGAFSPVGINGGLIGVMVMGIRRAVFSNEAGIGSSPVIHAAAKADNPIKEGLVAMLEPFIDTVIICSMTALVLIFTGFHEVENIEGVSLTSAAYGSVISWFPYVLLVSVLFFAFSSLISWSYYGLQGFLYLFGNHSHDKKKIGYIYQLLFLVFTTIGATISLQSVIDFSDMMLFCLAFPNILTMYFLSGEIKIDLKNYFKGKKQRNANN